RLALESSVAVEVNAHRRGPVGIYRRARADEPEVVQEGSAERAHEEMVGQRVLARPFPHRQRRAVVRSHDETSGGRDRGRPVGLAAVDLLLVLVEGMDEVARGL